MPLPDDLDFDQAPDKPPVDWAAESRNSYAQGAIKACRAILMVISQGGSLEDVKRVAQGAIDRMEMDNADVQC